jgi:hypothetical protein
MDLGKRKRHGGEDNTICAGKACRHLRRRTPTD